MKRVVVVYRCGYDATRLYAEGVPGDLERVVLDAAARDCEYCESLPWRAFDAHGASLARRLSRPVLVPLPPLQPEPAA